MGFRLEQKSLINRRHTLRNAEEENREEYRGGRGLYVGAHSRSKELEKDR